MPHIYQRKGKREATWVTFCWKNFDARESLRADNLLDIISELEPDEQRNEIIGACFTAFKASWLRYVERFGERLGLFLQKATWKAFASVNVKDGKTALDNGIFDIFAEIPIDASTPTETWAMMFCMASLCLNFNGQMANMRKLKKHVAQTKF